jgi:uncharacterized membrane protein YhfC
MTILHITYPLNGLLMIIAPVLLGIYLRRKFGLKWRLWWIGCATFIISQVGHIPFNIALGRLFELLPRLPDSMIPATNAVVLGLSAGLWEEVARYAAYRWWAKDARSWTQGLMVGAGHGGIEAIGLGLYVLFIFINVLVASNMDLTTAMPPEQALQAQEDIRAYWSVPWAATLLGALERAFAIVLHLSLSLLVLQVFIRRQIFWLWLAILWHALVDAIGVYTVVVLGPYESEAMIAAFVLVSLAIIFLLRPSDQPDMIYHEGEERPSPDVEEPELPERSRGAMPDIVESAENLDKTRYS